MSYVKEGKEIHIQDILDNNRVCPCVMTSSDTYVIAQHLKASYQQIL